MFLKIYKLCKRRAKAGSDYSGPQIRGWGPAMGFDGFRWGFRWSFDGSFDGDSMYIKQKVEIRWRFDEIRWGFDGIRWDSVAAWAAAGRPRPQPGSKRSRCHQSIFAHKMHF